MRAGQVYYQAFDYILSPTGCLNINRLVVGPTVLWCNDIDSAHGEPDSLAIRFGLSIGYVEGRCMVPGHPSHADFPEAATVVKATAETRPGLREW